ncbi:MAG TPA: ChbG/HpnK family deacetylase, partial [Epsilonproteobacteria bacterium]|nr:ChbG/HpnK family deacetylase [Campylobacterota bacterium]
MNNIIVNADDLGMTPGTNKAIFEGYDKGKITHASIMSNCDYFENAILGLKNREELKIGIHLNLTYGKALHSCLFYTNKQGIFNLGYLSIIRKSIFHKDFLSEVKKEFELQILRVHDLGITISHLDSHRHIHLIPEIYKIVIDLAEKYDISKVRLINEDFFNSLSLSKRYNFILNGGLIKFILLKYF